MVKTYSILIIYIHYAIDEKLLHPKVSHGLHPQRFYHPDFFLKKPRDLNKISCLIPNTEVSHVCTPGIQIYPSVWMYVWLRSQELWQSFLDKIVPISEHTHFTVMSTFREFYQKRNFILDSLRAGLKSKP